MQIQIPGLFEHNNEDKRIYPAILKVLETLKGEGWFLRPARFVARQEVDGSFTIDIATDSNCYSPEMRKAIPVFHDQCHVDELGQVTRTRQGQWNVDSEANEANIAEDNNLRLAALRGCTYLSKRELLWATFSLIVSESYYADVKYTVFVIIQSLSVITSVEISSDFKVLSYSSKH